MIYKTKGDLISAAVRESDTVLDVGFSGQGIREGSGQWPHALLEKRAASVYGVDLDLPERYLHDPRYQRASAEDFRFPAAFDVIFAGDLIEHLSNPGLFLKACRAHLKPAGRLILTTPNTFNLFNLAEKLTKREPTVNPDHTLYLNDKTLGVLLRKNDFRIAETGYVYTLGYGHKESAKKKLLNLAYWLLSKFTDKFMETLVVIAEPTA